ncbi:MAG TPA: hypothetical protein VNJ46_09730 [Gaiellaceae bacterium]|nr:hypothetical protein [Gaiellaceae bacterium]
MLGARRHEDPLPAANRPALPLDLELPFPSSTTYTSSKACGACASAPGATSTCTPTSSPGEVWTTS